MYNWVTKRKIPRTEGPTYPARAAQTVDTTVAKWIPATVALLACFVTPARAKLDARYYESPNYPVRATQTVDATVRTWQPADTTELASFSTPARPTLDIRRYEWAPAFVSIPRLIDPTVAKWAPAFATELASFSASARPVLDGRRYDWDVSESAWIQATQTVAPTVAQTVPAWADDGGRTPAASSLDVRRYDWTAAAFSIAPLLDPTVSTWAPTFSTEIAGVRTTGRVLLDVRQYDWAPAFTNIVPLGSSAGGGERTSAAGPDFLVRRVVERTTGPQDLSWFYGLAAIPVTPDQLWPAIWSGGVASSVTPSRARLEVRGFDWQPSAAWIAPAVDAVVQTWTPAFAAPLGIRTADRLTLDVRTSPSAPDTAWLSTAQPPALTTAQAWPAIWQPVGADANRRTRTQLSESAPQTAPLYYPALTVSGPSTAQVAPAWTSQAQSFRTASAAIDTRQTIEAFVSLAFQVGGGPTVAQTAPAWIGETQSFRTPSRPALDLFRAQSIPDIFGVPDDWTLWTPALTHGERTPDRPRLDVRAIDPGQPAWIFTALPAASTTAAQRWPAILEGSGLSYRTVARSQLDVRQFEWQPAFSWIAPTVDAVVRTWSPVFDAEVGVRTSDGAKLDVRTSPWSPQDGWLFAAQPPALTVAAAWPAIWSSVGANYRTAARPALDLRSYDWQPSFTWVAPVVDVTVRTWLPIVDAEESRRTIDAIRFDVRRYEWAPEPAWVFSALPVPATVAQQWPAVLLGAGLSYRTGDRGRLDPRGYEFHQIVTWAAQVVVPYVAARGDRLMVVDPADRLMPVPHDDRQMIIPFDLRSFPVTE